MLFVNFVERDVKVVGDENFRRLFAQRDATAIATNALDIVLNNLAGLAWTTKESNYCSDERHGVRWCTHSILSDNLTYSGGARRVVHNRSLMSATLTITTQSADRRSGSGIFPGCKLILGKQGADNRSYRVSFEKIKANLPVSPARMDGRRGASSYTISFNMSTQPERFNSRRFLRVKATRISHPYRQIARLLLEERKQRDHMTFTETPLKGAYIIDLEPPRR